MLIYLNNWIIIIEVGIHLKVYNNLLIKYINSENK